MSNRLLLVLVFYILYVKEVRGHGYLATPGGRNNLYYIKHQDNCTVGSSNVCALACPPYSEAKCDNAILQNSNRNGLAAGGPWTVYGSCDSECSGCAWDQCGWGNWTTDKCKCTGARGMCGDAASAPQDHIEGGKYSNGFVNGVYKMNQQISLWVTLTMNHCGFFRVVLYVPPEANQENFNVRSHEGMTHFELKQAVIEPGKKYSWSMSRTWSREINPELHWVIPQEECKSEDMMNRRDYFLKYVLPEGITCKRCVLQWHYITQNAGNHYERPEEFWNCADISIYKEDGKPPGVEWINADDWSVVYKPTGAKEEAAGVSYMPYVDGGEASINPNLYGTKTNENCGGIAVSGSDKPVEKHDHGAIYRVTFKNTGSKNVPVRFRVDPAPRLYSNVVKLADGSFELPEYIHSKYVRANGEEHVWEYLSDAKSPSKITFITPSC